MDYDTIDNDVKKGMGSMSGNVSSDRGGARRKGGLLKVLVKVGGALALIGALGFGALFVADWLGGPSKKEAIQSIIANMVDIPGKGFKMGKYEVTQAQWQAVMGENPSEFKYWFKWNNPVENVSWNDCKEFLWRLNALPEVKASGLTFRLPTEEEWKYACKAGGTGDYCRLADGTEITERTIRRVAWYDANSKCETHQVGQKQPNAFGLHDMHGNVLEWCEDKYNASGNIRVLRGGCWGDDVRSCRSADSSWSVSGSRSSDCGFRLCCSEGEEPVVKEAAPVAPTASSSSPKAGDTKTLTLPGGVKMEMIYVEPGSFMMGSPTSEDGRESEETQHHVTLTKGFWLGKYEVTQKQWQSVMGGNPSHFKGDDRPVENVSWNDCQEFVKKVNAQLNCGARLPTEAEWECACRAGTTMAYSWGNALNGDKANCNGNYPCGTTVKGRYKEETAAVGTYPANAWGFHDMHGNVYEWCNDWYGEGYYKNSPPADPQGPASGDSRVLRGGCWSYRARYCRSAYRDWYDPGYRISSYGFRLCCSAQP